MEGNCYGIILGAVLQFPEEMEVKHENLNPVSSNLVLHKKNFLTKHGSIIAKSSRSQFVGRSVW